MPTFRRSTGGGATQGDSNPNGGKLEPIDPDLAKQVTKEVLDNLDKATRQLIVAKDARHYTPRENQKSVVGFLAALLNHTRYRERYVEQALNNPMQAMSQGIATLPKEIMVENHTYLEKVEIYKHDALSVEQWSTLNSAKPDIKVLEAKPIEDDNATFKAPVVLNDSHEKL